MIIEINPYENNLNFNIGTEIIKSPKIKQIIEIKFEPEIEKFINYSDLCCIHRCIDVNWRNFHNYLNNSFKFFIYSKDSSEISKFIDNNLINTFGINKSDQEVFNNYFELTIRILNSRIIHKLMNFHLNNYYRIRNTNNTIETRDIIDNEFCKIIYNDESLKDLNPEINSEGSVLVNNFEIRPRMLDHKPFQIRIRTRRYFDLYLLIINK